MKKMNQKGQAVTESILIIVVLMTFTFTIASYFRNEEILKRIITGPFAALAGMLQNGSWAPVDKSSASHPTGHGRHIAIEGEPGR